jgi:class 3 adenylate cyclase
VGNQLLDGNRLPVAGHRDGDIPTELESTTSNLRRARIPVIVAGALAAALPIVGLVSLLLRSQLDPDWENPRLHFTLFISVGAAVVVLAYLAGEAAERRGDARVFLLSVAFLATGGFLAIHAVGTPRVLVTADLSGFQVAISAGLVVAAVLVAGSAFVDLRPGFAPAVIRHRRAIRGAVVALMGIWIVWTATQLAPLSNANSEGATGSLLAILAAVGAATYALSALRYGRVYRGQIALLPASVIAGCILLAEAMVGVAATGERSWHASWWEWHALIVLAYLIVLFAAWREWSEERFRRLYLPTTRERTQDLSVLFGDLAGYTKFSERSAPSEVAAMLRAYYAVATPLLARRYGGEVENFMGDGLMATFNRRGDQPDHAVRAARAALELQRRVKGLADEHPTWPQMRVGVNSGEVAIREMGGQGRVEYAVVGDSVNVGSRLEGEAPLGAVLIGAETYRRLPEGTVVEAMPGLHVKGKDTPVDAFILRTLPE